MQYSICVAQSVYHDSKENTSNKKEALSGFFFLLVNVIRKFVGFLEAGDFLAVFFAEGADFFPILIDDVSGNDNRRDGGNHAENL